jgi:O-antigen/teichoic acid export membrane protein
VALRLASLSSVSWVTVEKVAQQALWLILFSILAPILGPGPYGVFSIVMVFIGFCELVLTDGMVEVLVTLVDLEQPHVATTNLLAGLAAAGLGLLLCGLAPAVGALFQNDDIRRLMWALAPLPLLSFLSAAPIAMLRREMQFRRLALRSIASLALGGAAGIGWPSPEAASGRWRCRWWCSGSARSALPGRRSRCASGSAGHGRISRKFVRSRSTSSPPE